MESKSDDARRQHELRAGGSTKMGLRGQSAETHFGAHIQTHITIIGSALRRHPTEDFFLKRLPARSNDVKSLS